MVSYKRLVSHVPPIAYADSSLGVFPGWCNYWGPLERTEMSPSVRVRGMYTVHCTAMKLYSVIQGGNQRIYSISLLERTAIPYRLTKSQLTQPLPDCSVGSYTDGQVVQYTAHRAGRGWASWLFVRRGGVAVRSTSDICSLVETFDKSLKHIHNCICNHFHFVLI